MNGKKGGVGGGIKRKGLPKVDDDDVLSNPMLSTTATNNTKKAPLKDKNDDFLDESPFTPSTKSPKKAEPTKKVKPAPLLSPPSSSSSSSSSSMRRSLSADSDDFLYIDPFNANASKRKFEELEEDHAEAVKKLKLNLEKELEPTIPHLQGIWKGKKYTRITNYPLWH
jgi:hypothetical protein